MARVAVAYVEVRPELSKGFRTELNRQLEAVNETIKVKIEPDMKGLSGSMEKAMSKAERAAEDSAAEMQKINDKMLKKEMDQLLKKEAATQALNQRIESAELTHTNKMQAINDKMLKDESDELSKSVAAQNTLNRRIESNQVTHNNKMQAINDKMTKEEVDSQLREERAAQAERFRLQQASISQRIAAEKHGSKMAQTEESAALKERLRQITANNRLEEQLAALVAKNVVKERLRIENKATRDSERQADALQRVVGRHAAEAFTESFADQWRTRMTKITIHESRDIERSMTDRFGAVGSTVARAFIRDFNKEVDRRIQRQADRTGAGFLRRMARGMKGGGQVTRILGGMFKGIAGIADAAGTATSAAFEVMGKGLTTLLSQFSATSGIAAKFGEGLTQAGLAVGALVSTMVSLGLISALISTVVVGLNLVLGALLAIVIPLVGGITALVAELTALAGVGIGAIGLLPGVLGAAAAAFGPLLLVGDRFQKLFEDTSKHTGTLFVSLERLKNAIWAVLGTGFVQAIQGFVTNTLPKFFVGIEAVSAAWGRLLTGLVRLVSTQSAIAAFNTLFAQGAQLVDFFASAINVLGPALLSMAVAAQPALTSILGSVQGLVDAFGAWVSQMTASGQMTTFFNTIALILGQIMQILPPLASLMGAWITSLLGPVAQFVTLLGAMVDRWVALASSAQGMALIRNFFLAMNTIVAAFEPLLEQVVIMFLRFGPTLASLTTTAIPALQMLLATLMNLTTAVAPAVMTFLNAFNAALADPAVQASITQLGVAFGGLITALTAGAPMFASVIDFMALLLRILNPIITVVVALAGALTPVINLVAAILVPVLDALLVILSPLLKLLEWLASLLNKLVAEALREITKLFTDLGKWISWVAQKALANLKKKFEDLAGPLKWLGDKLSWLGDKLGWLGQKMGLTGDDATGMGTDTKNATDKMVGGLNGVAGAKAWDAIATSSQKIGDYMVDGVNVGISGAEKYINALNAMGAAAYNAKNEVDVATFEKNVGKAMNKTFNLNRASKSGKTAGIAAGSAFVAGYNQSVTTKFDTSTKKASTKGKMTAAGYISTFKAELSKLSGFTIIKGDTAYNTGKEIATYIAKGITSGKKNIDKVSKYISKTFSKKLTEMAGKNTEFWKTAKRVGAALPGFADKMKKFTSGKELDDYLAGRQKKYTDLLQQIVDFRAKAKDALTAGSNLVGYFGFIPTPAEVQARLDALKQQMLDFTTGLADLQKRGLSKELAAQWLMAGPEQAGNLVKAGAAATDEQLKQWSASFASIGTEADKATETAATNYFGVGQATVEGYIKGIQSMRDMAGKEMTALIDYVYKQVKVKLKIKSPSQVYASLGSMTVAGYNQGVAGMQSRAVKQVGRLMDAMRSVPAANLAPPRIRIPTVGPGALADRAARNEATYVKVFLGTREITDIIRVEQQRTDETKARAIYAGRKGV